MKIKMMDKEKTNHIVSIYRKRARGYNFKSNLYYLIGYRLWAYRKQAARELRLLPGGKVVEIGCGTGLNFSFLQKAVGSKGRITGVDATYEMLDQARIMVEREGWKNVELVHGDAANYKFPARVNGIISTLALSLIPNLDKIIMNGIDALTPGGRWVVMDLKVPSNWLSGLLPLLIPLVKPFGVTEKLINQRPWETIWNIFNQNLQNVGLKEIYLGTTYIASGEVN